MAVFTKIWVALAVALLLINIQGTVAEKVSKNPTDTITSGGDSTRSGYQSTHNLDPNVVSSGSFNQIWKQKLLGNYNGFTEQIYAQPLVFTPSGQSQFVYVISQMNIAYRLSATTGEILASRQLAIPFLVSPDLEGCNDIADCVGSTATGVIDPDLGVWYVTTKTYVDQTINTPQGLAAGRYYIHALDVMTLESKPNFPIPLEGIVADNAPWRVFEGGKHHQRPALLQVGDYIYAGFASHCVQWNFTGWVIGWHATEGRLLTKYAMEGGTEKSGIGGGIWMSGGGLASDNPGRMFFATGNGYASQLADDPVPGRQPPTSLEEAVVNMAINGDGTLTPTDFFMPWEKRDLDGMDKDLGTSGFALLDPKVFSTDSVKRIGCVAGKTGKLYFLNLDDLGGYQMGVNRKDKALQVIEMAGPVFATAGSWPHDGGYVYVTPVGHQTVAFKFGKNSAGEPVFIQAGVTTESAAGRQGVGHASVTSLNGQPGSGILWISDVDGSNLRAYGTVPVNGILPTLALLNNVGQVKFSRPTFGDGKVYLTSHTGYVTAFGSPVNMPLNCSSPYDAGTVNIGNTSTVSITCQSKIPLTINTIDLDISTNFKAFGYTLPKTMAAGETFIFSANFTPQAVGPLSTNINIRTTNGGTEQYAANTPVGIRGVALSQTPILTIQPNVLSFGESIVGADISGKDLQFSIQNDGQSPLVITGYQISANSSTGPFLSNGTTKSGPFTFVNLPPVGSSVPGTSSILTTVNFNGTEAGYFTVYLRIITNGGTKVVGAFGTAGSAPKAVLEWQRLNGTWVEFKAGVPFEFGQVPLGTQQFRTMRLSNKGGTTLTTTISKPPVSGALAAVNALGSIAEGSQIAPGAYEEASLICSPPKSQVNEDPTTLKAVWTMNNNDPTFGKHEIDFVCNGASTQVGPLDSNGQAWYRYLGCYKDANPTRNLEELLYYSVNNTNGICQTDCFQKPQMFPFAATQYEGECWCGTKAPLVKVADTYCQYLCKGNFQEYCGGDGAYMSLFADRRQYTPGNTTISSSSSSIASSTTMIPSSMPSGNISSTVIISSSTMSSNLSISITAPTISSTSVISSSTISPSAVPTGSYQYLGCANEGTNGRALSKDATASSTLTIQKCQEYCTGKGYPLSGMEYSTECYCGLTLENGSTIGGTTQCVMACGGDPAQICGGPGALSVYNNTLLGAPRTPAVVPSVDTFFSQGCYTEGLNERALAGGATAASNMTVAGCVGYCKAGGFRYAGMEYSTECYCGSALAATAAKVNDGDCNMLCGGDAYAYCGSAGRLNIYRDMTASNSTSSTIITTSPTASATPTVTSSTATPSATIRPNFKYVGCATEGTTGRALTLASFANSTMTLEHCQDYCTTLGHALSGVEYASECFCGTHLENGSTLGSPACTMPCAGNAAAICGGPSALSVYNNTDIGAAREPAVIAGAGGYVSAGCYAEGVGERALAGAATAASGMTVETCVAFCKEGKYSYAGVEYGTECYCGNGLAATAVKLGQEKCGMGCGGDMYAFCGGAGSLNVYVADAVVSSSVILPSSSAVSNSSITSSVSTVSTSPPVSSSSAVSVGSSAIITSSSSMIISRQVSSLTSSGASSATAPVTITSQTSSTPTTSPTSSTSSTPTARSEYKYLGCANEPSGGRALSKASFTNSTMTPTLCQDYCTTKGYPLSGAEYSTECYCGTTLENGSTLGGSTQCVMACGGNPDLVCGGPGALSVWNNTAVVLPRAPKIVEGVDGEGVNERALAGSMTTGAGMNVTVCVGFCKAGGYKYAGVEYSTECYCGAAITATAAKVADSQCGMLCGGDAFAYCGGAGRIGVYVANATVVSTSTLV
ncbi:uncharacterized protein H6S33_010939 [Morchella sextelata]|uniref:uncharacterized protein n=1 Tax=Morchella sextelata TaxID=1174677 RepID=UPI001D05B13E|nr:uncharacterized protein H6S33_010939 [Morchella sextelata]KAH0611674.1 hypothetical protein H6S33_010939 [Morchella sextelata]